ncbi:ATPase inhibitor, mitochondrial [Lethenteron reissneri]|uniref:ATPase inhibitor, mitochondrial n=1 Tax=Lethenteron reissneri TaxID=7753 RepID=UPI002AB7E8B3|nr:ATPase inhibitor, mitochondrial [Lethenteron reissneri]
MAAAVVMSGAVWRSATRGVRAVLCSSSSRAMSGESGGDRAGSVREAGGAFAKREKAEEERYFKKMNTDQLKSLSKHHEEEIKHSEAEIQRLKKEIERHKEKVKGLRKIQEDD